MNKILNWFTGDLVDAISNGLDKLFTSKEEKLQLRNELEKIINAKSLELLQIGKDIIMAEATGNWLQRSWRPILMLSFGFIVMYSKFIAPAFHLPNTVLEPDFWELLRLGIGGYVIGRSVEKVAPQITDIFKNKNKN